MNILYHLPILPPKLPQAEALSQEIAALQSRFGGDICYLNPNRQVLIYVPRVLFGFHKLKELRTRERHLGLHHFYNPDAFPFPILRLLRRPIIYTISSGLGKRPPNVKFFNSMAAVAVADERSFNQLQAYGVTKCVLVRPGIDLSRFTCSPLALHSKITLLIASAPWTRAQFHRKGIQALLEAARLDPHLRLIFLWRGILTGEMKQRVRRMGLEQQVTVVDEQVDVNQVLANVHATVALATETGIIKSFPHSLLDSLAAGKPVLVSRAIPMADYVEATNCGKVVEQVTAGDILVAVEALMKRYEIVQKSARWVGQRDFSEQAMISSYQKLYEYILETSKTVSR